MNTVEIQSLPQIRFAHAYEPSEYHGKLPKRENFIEITYVAQGSLLYQNGSEIILAEEGDVLCNLYKNEISIHADHFHSHHTAGASVSFSILENVMDHLYLPVHTKASADTQIICRLIDQLIYNPSCYIGSPAKGAGWFLRILSEIDTCNRTSNTPLFGEQLYVEKVKDYIHHHIHSPITQREVAAYLNLSPGYLCSIFKKAEHTTLLQYINRKKLEGIRLLMQQKNLRLNEAATLFGYSDANYVSRLHKKLFQYNITDKPTPPKG